MAATIALEPGDGACEGRASRDGRWFGRTVHRGTLLGIWRAWDGGSLEYQVEHPPWKIWEMELARFAGDAEALYGAEFARILNQPPDSAFLAEGSAVAVHTARRLA